ncbi:hypothetical protein ACQKDB_15705 [Planococcus kocurii]|uniref:hypothetical protein n=1 Tax=Planococcus TaxID=1372 RepID=UPI000585EF9F|nr:MULTISPECIES: hypothetical protein [Planococcus]AIY06652.1 hypothetical protein Plano_2687 [Planococcus sp. PAMC 21323]
MLKSKSFILGTIIAIFSITLIFTNGLQIDSAFSNGGDIAGDLFPNTELPFEN